MEHMEMNGKEEAFQNIILKLQDYLQSSGQFNRLGIFLLEAAKLYGERVDSLHLDTMHFWETFNASRKRPQISNDKVTIQKRRKISTIHKITEFSETTITVCRKLNLKSDTRSLQLKAKNIGMLSKVANIDNSRLSVTLYEKGSNNVFEQMGEKDSFLMNWASEDILKTTLQNGDEITQDEFEISIDNNISFLPLSEKSRLLTSTQDSGIANDDQSESTSSDAFSCNNVIESHEIEQVDDELSPNVCESENNVNYCMQDSGLEVSEVAQTDDLNNNYHKLDQQLYRHPRSTTNLSDENANICSITSTKDCDKKEVISEKKKNENDQKVSSSKQKKVKRKGKSKTKAKKKKPPKKFKVPDIMKMLEMNQRKRKKGVGNIFDSPIENDVTEQSSDEAQEMPHMDYADDDLAILRFEQTPKKKRKCSQKIGLDLQMYKNEVTEWFQSIEELPFADGIRKYKKIYECDSKDVTRLFYATLHLVNDGVLEIMTTGAPEDFLLRRL